MEAVLDHHADEGLYGSAKPRIIEMVGSTATLVAEQFFSAGAEVRYTLPFLFRCLQFSRVVVTFLLQTLLDATLAKIFLAPILVPFLTLILRIFL